MNKTLAYYAILGALVFMTSGTLCAATSNSQSDDAKTMITLFSGIVALWLLLAGNFSLTELNQKR